MKVVEYIGEEGVRMYQMQFNDRKYVEIRQI